MCCFQMVLSKLLSLSPPSALSLSYVRFPLFKSGGHNHHCTISAALVTSALNRSLNTIPGTAERMTKTVTSMHTTQNLVKFILLLVPSCKLSSPNPLHKAQSYCFSSHQTTHLLSFGFDYKPETEERKQCDSRVTVAVSWLEQQFF